MSAPETAKEAAAAQEHVKAAEVPEATKPQDATVEDVPDPDEDDLDDLDDMLDDFKAVKVDAKAETPQPEASQPKEATPPIPGLDAAAAGLGEDFLEEDFAKQLQAGMADLLGELEKSPDMQAQFEDMFKQMSGAAGSEKPADAPAGASKPAESGAAADESFQETIRKTMERMQSSGEQATAAASSGGEEDFMAEMLKQLGSGDFNAEGGEEEFSKMLMGMMEQLTNKEILYEPMKELSEKFPGWLEKNKASTPAEELKKYEEQNSLVHEIVAKFEEPTYADSNAADREFIVEKMQKMQAAGSPPSDLVGDMSSAQDALNMPDEQCNPQ